MKVSTLLAVLVPLVFAYTNASENKTKKKKGDKKEKAILDIPDVPDTPFDPECCSLDGFMPFERKTFVLKSSKGTVCPAAVFAREGIAFNEYDGLKELVENDHMLPGLMALMSLKQDIIPDIKYLSTIGDQSIVCASLMFVQNAFVYEEYKEIYKRLFHRKKISSTTLKYLNWPRLMQLNRGLKLDTFVSIVFKKKPKDKILIDYFTYWFQDGSNAPSYYNQLKIDNSEWTFILKDLLERLDQKTWFTMNIAMKRAVLRCPYDSVMRDDCDDFREELKEQEREKRRLERKKKNDEEVPDMTDYKRMTLVDPFRAIMSIGYGILDHVDALADELQISNIQRSTWVFRNTPDLKSLMGTRFKFIDALNYFRKQRNLDDEYILELLVYSMCRQPLTNFDLGLFDKYNHVTIPFPNVWKVHPIPQVARFLLDFDPEAAKLDPVHFKIPLLLIRSLVGTLDTMTYLFFEKAFYDAFLEAAEKKKQASGNSKKKDRRSKQFIQSDVSLDSLNDNEDEIPQPETTETTEETPAQPDEGEAPAANTNELSQEQTEEIVEPSKEDNGPTDESDKKPKEVVNIPPSAKASALLKSPAMLNRLSNGDPESFILYYALPLFEALYTLPDAPLILLETEVAFWSLMEHTPYQDRSMLQAPDKPTELYLSVMSTLSDLLFSYSLKPILPPPPKKTRPQKEKIKKPLPAQQGKKDSTGSFAYAPHIVGVSALFYMLII